MPGSLPPVSVFHIGDLVELFSLSLIYPRWPCELADIVADDKLLTELWIDASRPMNCTLFADTLVKTVWGA
jgi:hypothetical protein